MSYNIKISVIMPVYNAEKYIFKAVESILHQTETDFELLLLDDCGSDRSMDIVAAISDPRIRILKNKENKGIAWCRNRGIREAKGEYIALMDDDDLAPLNRLEIEKRFLDVNKNVDVVGGNMIIIDENDQCISHAIRVFNNPKRIKGELMFRNMMTNGSAMIRKSFIENNQLKYRDHYLGMEDYKFWTECSLKGNIANVEEIMLYWRKSENNETAKKRNEKKLERAQLFAAIQLETLKANGFDLRAEDKSYFIKYFDELNEFYFLKEDLERLLSILHKIISQAKEMQLDNAKEIEFVCKNMYSIKTKKSELWDC